MAEVGIYRVSGSASDLGRLKKSFETSECSVMAVTRLTDYWTYDVRNTVSSFLLPTLNCIDIVFVHVSIMHEINRDFFLNMFQER